MGNTHTRRFWYWLKLIIYTLKHKHTHTHTHQCTSTWVCLLMCKCVGNKNVGVAVVGATLTFGKLHLWCHAWSFTHCGWEASDSLIQTIWRALNHSDYYQCVCSTPRVMWLLLTLALSLALSLSLGHEVERGCDDWTLDSSSSSRVCCKKCKPGKWRGLNKHKTFTKYKQCLCDEV